MAKRTTNKLWVSFSVAEVTRQDLMDSFDIDQSVAKEIDDNTMVRIANRMSDEFYSHYFSEMLSFIGQEELKDYLPQ